jgi:O-succinylbenzoate synthase
VRANSDDGTTGLGEIAPLDGYSLESLSESGTLAEQLASDIRGTDVPTDFPALGSLLRRKCRQADYPPSVIFGIECVLADMAAKSSGLSLGRWLSPGSVDRVPVNALILGNANAVGNQMESLTECGYRTYKLKVGAESPEHDVIRVNQISDLLGKQAVLRLDANGAWDFDQASSVLCQLSGLNIEFVEEPLCGGNIGRLGDLHDATGMSFALDETVRNMELWKELIESEAVSAVILKPTIVGGFAKSHELFQRVAGLGKKVVVTSAFESGVGTAACLHLAASFGGDMPACGLSTLQYLSSSLITEQLQIADGCMHIPVASGIGVSLESGFME